MPNRDEQRVQASKHLALMKGAFASETEAAIASAVIYEDGEARELPLPDAPAEQTTVDVTTDFSVSVLYKTQGSATIVDPASFSKPGGAYEDGALGPEQLLCAESNLYPVLCGLKSTYYAGNRGYQIGQLFTDRALFLTDIMFSRKGEVRSANVIAISEPNRMRALENHRSERECEQSIVRRIESIMRIAATTGCETLICGAFGCGRQGFDPAFIAELFKAWIDEHPGAVPHVVFAVPRFAFDAFNDTFGTPEVEETPVVAIEQEEEDEYAFDPSDLPEGVTIR